MSARRLLVSALAPALLAVAPAGAHAATFVVTKPADTLDGACNSDCSLREAVQAANAAADADEIVLGGSVFRLERLGNDSTNVNGDLDVTQDLTITGAGPAATIVQGFAGDRIMDLTGAATAVTLRGLAITGGQAIGAANDRGGGIRVVGDIESLTGEQLVVRGNTATGNVSFGYGGGIYAENAEVRLRNSALIGNRAVSDGFGGGMFVNQLSNVVLQNVTMAGNHASVNGGGVFVNTASSSLAGEHVTVVRNEAGSAGGGLDVNNAAVRLRSSVVAQNTATDCGEAYVSEGGNVGGGTCGFASPADFVTPDPQLGSLTADAVPVFEPPAGSPAIDRAAGACPATDARGLARPQGGACDSGAAERPVPPPPPPPTTVTTTVTTTVPGPPSAPAPTPAPGADPVPRAGLPVSLAAMARRGRVQVVLACLTGSTCTGTAVLRVGGRPVTSSRSLRLRPGRVATVTLTLTRAGRRVIARRARTAGQLSITRTDGGPAQTESVQVRRSR